MIHVIDEISRRQCRRRRFHPVLKSTANQPKMFRLFELSLEKSLGLEPVSAYREDAVVMPSLPTLYISTDRSVDNLVDIYRTCGYGWVNGQTWEEGPQ